GCISVGFEFMPPGGFDQRTRTGAFGQKDSLPLAARQDVLVFATPPLERDLEVTGPITVTLWASSSARDTDFTAKLIDVCPPSAPGGMVVAENTIYHDAAHPSHIVFPVVEG